MSASAGRVLLMPKGTYDAETTYEMLDLVRYGKSTFVCKKTSTGNTPDSNQDTEYWQLLVTSGDVSGVKGNAEATYREGNVNLTFEDLGIDSELSSTSDNAVKNKAVYAALATKQDTLTFDTAPTTNSTNPVTSSGIKTALDTKLSTTDDTTTNVTTFTSSDDSTSTDKTNAGMTEVITMTSGESHASLFQKISKMFLNIRKLWNTVGTTAIPSDYGTTLTGVINNFKTTYNTYSTSETWTGEYWIDGRKIYRKTFIYNPVTKGIWLNTGVAVDAIISKEVNYLTRSYHGNRILMLTDYYFNDDDYQQILLSKGYTNNNNALEILFRQDANKDWISSIVTIKYTKPTT